MADDPPVSQVAQGSGIAQAIYGGTASVNVTLPPPAQPSRDPDRLHFLTQLGVRYRWEWEDSLYGVAQLALRLAEKPDAVLHHIRLLHLSDQHPEHLLPESSSIADVYDEAGHELLILGEPGSGKSTLLLALARELVERAENDGNYPLPIICRLSTWAQRRSSLAEWMIGHIQQSYKVSAQILAGWIQANQILPLLDGLDEVPQELRHQCIEAILTYQKEHITPLVICSRRAEYEALTPEKRIVLHDAVVVQPLTRQQVDTYLEQAGPSLVAVQTILRTNTVLAELTTTPLMLSILTLTYSNARVRDLPQQGSAMEQQRQIFTTYIEQMVQRRPGKYSLQQTQLWLGWLARQMRLHNQTIFYLEHLQPDWLPESYRHAYTWLGVLVPGIVIGCLISPVIALFLGLKVLQPQQISPITILHIGLLGGFVGGLFSNSLSKKVASLPRMGSSALNARHVFKIYTGLSILIGLVYGLCYALRLGQPGGLVGFYGYGDWLREGSLFGGIIALSCWLLMRIFVRDFLRPSQHISPGSTQLQRVFGRLLHSQQRQRILQVAIILGGGAVLINGLQIGLYVGMRDGPSNGLAAGLSFGLANGLSQGIWFGLTAILVSLILKGQTRDVRLAERLRWTWKSLLSSMFAPKHLKATGQFMCFLILLIGTCVGLSIALGSLSLPLSSRIAAGLHNGLNVGLSAGLSAGLSYWFLFGLLQSIVQERVEDQKRQIPNEGIRRSLRTCILMCFIGAAVLGCMSILGAGLGVGLSNILYDGPRNLSKELIGGLAYGLSIVLPGALSGGLVICAYNGGLAVLRHTLLRLLLARTNTFPRQAAAFLEETKVRILLRRVGGGYSFIHRLLLDYLADLEQLP